MSKNLYSILKNVEQVLNQYAKNEFWAKSTASIDSTLETIYWYNDFDRHCEIKILLKLNIKRTELIRLAILSYYVPKTLGTYLRLAISQKVQNNIDLMEVQYIITSKDYMLLWLSDQCQTLTGNQIFGNMLNKNDWSEKSVSSLFKLRKIRNHKTYKDHCPAKRTIGVGYRDKGTLSKTHIVPIVRKPINITQTEIEDRRAQADTLTKMLEGFLW